MRRQTRVQEAREEEAKAQEEREKREVEAQGGLESDVRAQEGREGELKAQDEREEDANSMQDESHVSNRHMTWWQNAWWVRVNNGPHLRTARDRRKVWRAATRAAQEVRETGKVAGREREEWEKRETERRESKHVAHCAAPATNSSSISDNHSNSSNHDRGSSSRNGSDSRDDAASVTSTTGVPPAERAGQQERVVLPSSEEFCSGAGVQAAISWRRVFTGAGFAALGRHSCCQWVWRLQMS